MLLTTDRLRLRPLEASDAPALHRALGDPVAMAAYEHGLSLEETHDWIARQQQRYLDDGFGLWAMVHADTGELIGDAGITTQPVGDETVIEVGYHLARAWWGQGYATEAARACTSWAFATQDTDLVYARIRDTNIASMNVAIRLGMTVRQRFMVHYRGIDMPHLAFAIGRDRWDTQDVRR